MSASNGRLLASSMTGALLCKASNGRLLYSIALTPQNVNASTAKDLWAEHREIRLGYGVSYSNARDWFLANIPPELSSASWISGESYVAQLALRTSTSHYYDDQGRQCPIFYGLASVSARAYSMPSDAVSVSSVNISTLNAVSDVGPLRVAWQWDTQGTLPSLAYGDLAALPYVHVTATGSTSLSIPVSGQWLWLYFWQDGLAPSQTDGQQSNARSPNITVLK